MQAADFRPRGLLRNPHVQSVLASSGLRRLAMKARVSRIAERSREHVFEIGPDTRLQGFLALPDGELESIRAALRKRFGREVEVETAIDESLIGGAVIDAGDVVIDGSLRGRLSRLQSALAG